jgi:hypothetical protein
MGIPYRPESATSKEAAESMVFAAKNQRAMCWEYIRSQGSKGATADEVNVALGVAHGCTIRITELVRLGRVERIKTKRKTRTGRHAFVHVAIEPQDWVDQRPGWPCPKREKMPTKDQQLALWKRRAYKQREIARALRKELDKHEVKNEDWED